MFRSAAITLTLCLVTVVAQAATVSVVAIGHQTDFYDPLGLLPFSQTRAGTEFTIAFTYDSDTPDVHPDPNVGAFVGAISELSLSVGYIALPALAENFVLVGNGIAQTNAGPNEDVWIANSHTYTPSLSTYIELILFDFAGEGFESDALVEPSFPWSHGFIDYAIEDKTDPNQKVTLAKAEAQVHIVQVTSVPAPAAGWLLGTAVAGLCGRRLLRRKVTEKRDV